VNHHIASVCGFGKRIGAKQISPPRLASEGFNLLLTFQAAHQADRAVAPLGKLLDQPPSEDACGTGNEYFHRVVLVLLLIMTMVGAKGLRQ
jgi:hypothetical protein